MPLSILIPMVVIGIAGIAMLLHFLGLTAPARFENEAAVARAWLREFPDLEPRRVVLSHDRRAALVETEDGPGVVWPMGADTTARLLDGAQVTQHKDGVQIDLPDYTAPRIRLKLDAEEARVWPRMMERKT